jgi:hypothetical protein
MPNWCKGTLKVRGEKSNLEKFVFEGLQPVGFFGEAKEPLKEDEWGNVYTKGTCWIEGTHRGFVEGLDLDLSDIEYGGVIHLDAKFAWGVDVEGLQKLCQKYNVDIRMYAFERGMHFNQEVEIINGEITMDNEITFDDYDWECPCPCLGG